MRTVAIAVAAMSLVTCASFLHRAEARTTAVMVLAYLLSAVFWLYASFRAEFADAPQALHSPNLANAIAASLAAVGTAASVPGSWFI